MTSAIVHKMKIVCILYKFKNLINFQKIRIYFCLYTLRRERKLFEHFWLSLLIINSFSSSKKKLFLLCYTAKKVKLRIVLMSTITFDTHKFIRKLRDAGFEEKQAEAVADAFQEAQLESLPVTRDYLDARLFELENRLVKWGIGLALGQFAMIAALVKLL